MRSQHKLSATICSLLIGLTLASPASVFETTISGLVNTNAAGSTNMSIQSGGYIRRLVFETAAGLQTATVSLVDSYGVNLFTTNLSGSNGIAVFTSFDTNIIHGFLSVVVSNAVVNTNVLGALSSTNVLGQTSVSNLTIHILNETKTPH